MRHIFNQFQPDVQPATLPDGTRLRVLIIVDGDTGDPYELPMSEEQANKLGRMLQGQSITPATAADLAGLRPPA